MMSFRRSIVALVLLSLAGCAGASGDYGTFTVARGSYDHYDCGNLEQLASGSLTRVTELAQQMARASKGAGGEFVNVIAYRSDYEYSRAQHNEALRAMGEKNCRGQSKWSSERAIR